MKVEVLKTWGKYKKGDTLELKDKTVIDKGIKIGLLKEGKETKTKE